MCVRACVCVCVCVWHLEEAEQGRRVAHVDEEPAAAGVGVVQLAQAA